MSEKPQIDNVEFLISLYKKADDKGKEIIAKNVVKSQDNHIDQLLNCFYQARIISLESGRLKYSFHKKPP